ncbi:MAG: hypothetical protein AAF526_03620 [Pseudomonadota bacterium]
MPTIMDGHVMAFRVLKELRKPVVGLTAQEATNENALAHLKVDRSKRTGLLSFEIDTGTRMQRPRTFGGKLSRFLDLAGFNGSRRRMAAMEVKRHEALPKAVNELTKRMVEYAKPEKTDEKLDKGLDALADAVHEAQGLAGHSAGEEIGDRFKEELQASVLSVLAACTSSGHRFVNARARLIRNLDRSEEALTRRIDRLTETEAANGPPSDDLRNLRAMRDAMQSVRAELQNYEPAKGTYLASLDPRQRQTDATRSEIVRLMTSLNGTVSVCNEYRQLFDGIAHLLPDPNSEAFMRMRKSVRALKETEKGPTIKASRLQEARAAVEAFPPSFHYDASRAEQQYNQIASAYKDQARVNLTMHLPAFSDANDKTRNRMLEEKRREYMEYDAGVEAEYPCMCYATMEEKGDFRDSMLYSNIDNTLEPPEHILQRVKDRFDNNLVVPGMVGTRSILAYTAVVRQVDALIQKIDNVPSEIIDDDTAQTASLQAPGGASDGQDLEEVASKRTGQNNAEVIEETVDGERH